MKLDEILNEGMEFHAAVIDGNYIKPHNMRKHTIPCWVCDGSGKDSHDENEPCGMCNGRKTIEEHTSGGPTLQVANANGMAIVRDILQQEPDYAGMIDAESMPVLRRRLIKFLNKSSEREPMHKDPSQERGDMSRKGSTGNVTNIGYGATMVDFGRSDDQVKRYAQRILDIVEYAVKHDCVLSWS